jgi:hypothetical protein
MRVRIAPEAAEELRSAKRWYEEQRRGRRSAAGGGTAVVWLETPPPRGCNPADDACRFVFYVGELINDHASRWATFSVGAPRDAMTVTSLDQMEPQPYAVWRKRRRP